MASNYKKLPNEPIVIVTLPKDYDLKADLPKTLPTYLKELSSFKEPVFWIVDASVAPLTVTDLSVGAGMVARGEHPLYKHPNIRQVIYVTTSSLLKLAADGMGTEKFNKIAIKLFDNVDAALAFCRESQ